MKTKVINLRDKQAVAIAKLANLYIRIDRATIWGNPYHIGKDGDRASVIAKHKLLILSDEEIIKKIKQELKGKTLACWCHPLPCHGDTYVEIADA